MTPDYRPHATLSRLPWRRRRQLRENLRAFQLHWGELADYNAEVSRGVVHTPEYQARMAQRQAAWNRVNP